MPLDPQTAALLRLIDDAGYPPMAEGTPETARTALRAMTVDWVTPETQIPVGSVESTEAGGVPVRVYRPASSGPVPTLVYLHGGGFVIGDLDTHDQTCRRFCRDAEVVVVSVDYRLAPEAPFPAAVDDVLAAVDWVAGHEAELGGAGRVVVAGDSAGGNLAAVAAQARRDAVDAQVLLYPTTHMAGDYPSRTENAEGYFLDLVTMHWFAGHYLGTGTDLDDARHSPLLGDLDGVAPALVVTTEYDPLRDEGEAYADRLAEAGVRVDRVRYDGLVHGFADMVTTSAAAEAALDDVVARTRALVRD